MKIRQRSMLFPKIYKKKKKMKAENEPWESGGFSFIVRFGFPYAQV